MSYKTLNADHITATVVKLREQLEKQFPGRGLVGVCAELQELSEDHVANVRETEQPRPGLRLLVFTVIATGALVIGWLILQKIKLFGMNASEFNSFEGVEAIVNMLILTGAGLWFLLNLETRLKREKTLEHLHELRSIAHVIDMHQLNKTPRARFALYDCGPDASDSANLHPDELIQYLDFCAEMLAITGKVAALYMQGLRDTVVIQAVNEIEELTSNLSLKIWQKIIILRVSIGQADETELLALAPAEADREYKN